jgi:hypothetical protein
LPWTPIKEERRKKKKKKKKRRSLSSTSPTANEKCEVQKLA